VISQGAGELSQVACGRGCLKSRVCPQQAPDDSDGVGEGGLAFAVPSSALDEWCALRPLAMSNQGDERKQAEEGGCRPTDGLLRPAASGFDSQVVADLVECHLQLPPQDEPGHDLGRGGVEVRAEESLGREGVVGVADEDPANGDGRVAGAVPQRRVGDDLDGPVGLAVPERDGQGVQIVVGSPRRAARVGSRVPTTRERPFCFGTRGGGGANRRASRRRRVTMVATERVAARNSRVA